MKQITILMLVNSLTINGISTVINNYCTNINHECFRIIVAAGPPINYMYKETFKNNNVELIELPNRKKKTLKYYIKLFKIFSEYKCDILHIHANSATVSIELLIAWLCNVKLRIVHSHNSSCKHKFMHRLLLPIFTLLCNGGIACSDIAGKWLFKKKDFYILPNGFDTKEYKFNDLIREKTRKELRINDEFVIGHVGRFNTQKNQMFIIKIFEELMCFNDNVKLLLVGDGPDFNRIKEIVDKHPNNDKIILYGPTHNTASLYNAMDVFVFPSLWEGLGIVAIEAQICGLPCVVSNVVPKDVEVGNTVEYMSLEKTPLEWARCIMNKYNSVEDRLNYYENNYSCIKKYNIFDNVKMLEKIYGDFLADIDKVNL